MQVVGLSDETTTALSDGRDVPLPLRSNAPRPSRSILPDIKSVLMKFRWRTSRKGDHIPSSGASRDGADERAVEGRCREEDLSRDRRATTRSRAATIKGTEEAPLRLTMVKRTVVVRSVALAAEPASHTGVRRPFEAKRRRVTYAQLARGASNVIAKGRA